MSSGPSGCHSCLCTTTMESPTKRPKTKGVPVTKLLGSQTPISSTSKSTKKVKQKLETRFSLASHETVAPPANAKNSEPKQQGPRRLVVVSGSYDKILYGLQIEPKSEESEEVHQFKPIFIFPAHISCIKAVAASPRGGKWLVSGGTDEVIKVWDLRRKKELGSLQQHQGQFEICTTKGTLMVVIRVSNASFISDSDTSPLSIGRRHDMLIPHKRLGSSRYSEGTSRSRQ